MNHRYGSQRRIRTAWGVNVSRPALRRPRWIALRWKRSRGISPRSSTSFCEMVLNAIFVATLSVFCATECLAQLSGELGAHDPSTVVQDGSTYYYLATGDGLAIRSSGNLANWSNRGAALDATPAWIYQYVPNFDGVYWAPDVIELNNQYYLYYSASQWGTKLSTIGYATSPTLNPSAPDYGWTDQGEIVHSTHATNYNAIDPSLLYDDATQRLWMTWGSFNAGIFVTELDPTTGGRLSGASFGTNVAAPGPTVDIEGASLVKHDDYFYLFVNWGGCCSGVDSTYNIRVGRSASPTGPFLDQDGVNLLSGGGTLFLDDDGAKIGPGHFSFTDVGGRDQFSYHYYNGDAVGAPTFGLRDLYWTSAGWPSLAEVDGVWSGGTLDAWNDGSSWRGGIAPNGAGHVATLSAAAGRPRQVAIEGSGVTAGTVNFRGPLAFTVGSIDGPALTLDDVNGEKATLNVAEGSHTVAAPVTAVDPLGVNVTPAGSNLSLAGRLVAPSLTKYGAGVLTLAGSNDQIAGSILVKNGKLAISGAVTSSTGFNAVGQILGETASLEVNGTGRLSLNGDLNIGDTGDSSTPATGTLTIRDDASVVVGTGGGFYVGSGFFANTRAEGTVVQSGGSLTVNRPGDGSFVVGGRTSALAHGVYRLSGGSVAANTNVFIGGRGSGEVEQSGGVFNASQYLAIGRFANSTGAWTIDGGVLNQTNASTWLLVGEEGNGSLTVSGDGMVVSNGTVFVGYRPSGVGEVHLDGGVLEAHSLVGARGQSTLALNGGKLRAMANQTQFLQGLTDAYIEQGGAIVDTQEFQVRVAQPLLHAESLGRTPDGGLVKQGVGALTLSAANSYVGPTLVQEGTLLVNNTTGSGTGFGQVRIADQAFLGGAGNIAGDVVVEAGGTLAPGVSVGTLFVGGVQLDDAATLQVDLGGGQGRAGIDFDQLVVVNDAALSGALEVNLAGTFAPTPGEVFTIMDISGTRSGIFTGLTQGALVASFDT
ncbi:MAG: family 43 glycosylhydrolase, partial [Planctomycetales bacterium]|nr:family 43 glycosylhydrolase [Planctomycetales bacterium]